MRTAHVNHLNQKRKIPRKPVASDSDAGKFVSTFLPGPSSPLPDEFGRLIMRMEKIIGMPVLVVILNDCPHCGKGLDIGMSLYKAVQVLLESFPEGRPMAILLESPGGDAHFAYRIARMLQRRTRNNFLAVIPQYAKSAATLIALGARSIILGEHAEIGPLDVQEEDLDKEKSGSALDAVQSLEHLNSFGLKAYDQAMRLMVLRTGKRMDILMPHALTYVSNFLSPLLQKIDTVDFTHKARELKVAEEYAVRLMIHAGYSRDSACRIAKNLVVSYPTHGFVIDRDEASGSSSDLENDSETHNGLRLNILNTSGKLNELEGVMFDLIPFLDGISGPHIVIGRIERQENEKRSSKSGLHNSGIAKNGHSGSR